MSISVSHINSFLKSLSFSIAPVPEDVFSWSEVELASVEDEALILLWRQGADTALHALETRYFMKRFAISELAVPHCRRTLEEWDLNEAFFKALVSAIQFYSFEARFSTFFVKVLRNEILREFSWKRRQEPEELLSLDAEDEEGGCLGDTISVDSTRDPISYCYFNDLLEYIRKRSVKCWKIAIMIFQEATLQEIARSLGMSMYAVRSYHKRIQKLALKYRQLCKDKTSST